MCYLISLPLPCSLIVQAIYPTEYSRRSRSKFSFRTFRLDILVQKLEKLKGSWGPSATLYFLRDYRVFLASFEEKQTTEDKRADIIGWIVMGKDSPCRAWFQLSRAFFHVVEVLPTLYTLSSRRLRVFFSQKTPPIPGRSSWRSSLWSQLFMARI